MTPFMVSIGKLDRTLSDDNITMLGSFYCAEDVRSMFREVILIDIKYLKYRRKNMTQTWQGVNFNRTAMA